MFLSQDDLKALSGLQRPSAVKRWLDKERIRYLVGADAWPRVLRVVVTERLGGKVVPPPMPEPQLILNDYTDGKNRPWDLVKARKKRNSK